MPHAKPFRLTKSSLRLFAPFLGEIRDIIQRGSAPETAEAQIKATAEALGEAVASRRSTRTRNKFIRAVDFLCSAPVPGLALVAPFISDIKVKVALAAASAFCAGYERKRKK